MTETFTSEQIDVDLDLLVEDFDEEICDANDRCQNVAGWIMKCNASCSCFPWETLICLHHADMARGAMGHPMFCAECRGIIWIVDIKPMKG